MRYINIFVLIFALITLSFAQDQSIKNIEYLNQLDKNITRTIEMLEAFNDAANKIEIDVKGWNVYSNFLMELTLECSNIRKQIAAADTLNDFELERHIATIISYLKPDVPYPVKLDASSELLDLDLMNLSRKIKKKQKNLRQEIIDTENRILNSGSFSKYYLSLHSENYIYSLLLDYLQPSTKLSNNNKKYLHKIGMNIYKEFIRKREIDN